MKPNAPLLLMALFQTALSGTSLADLQCPGSVPGVKKVFWGDLHVHTSASFDSYGFGNRADANQAYLFAKRQGTITLENGKRVQIDRKLDFTTVTDHSEYLGYTELCSNSGSSLYWTALCISFRGLTGIEAAIPGTLASLVSAFGATRVPPLPPLLCSVYPEACESASKTVWARLVKAAKEANNPCGFTTFQAFEWTALPGGATLHRNVIFANDTVPALPLDYLHYTTPSALWEGLERECNGAGTGCEALAIPHNSNLSQGQAFDLSGLSTTDLLLRAKYEKLVELHQHKGNSECLNPNMDDTNPDCLFETDGTFLGLPVSLEKYEKTRAGFVRPALGNGLAEYPVLGFNPLQLGFVGATDTHNATPGNVKESTFPGHGGELDGQPRHRLSLANRDFNPGGITGIWAEENTRESLFGALQRRETYATSGPRIVVRLGQTWDASTDYCAGGKTLDGLLPMGGTLGSAPAPGAKPRFVIQAFKDEANLARIDIIKATLVGGTVVEKVIPLSAPDPKNGASSLCRTFVDNEFRGEPAFWYARVVEVPTWRWSHYDCQEAPFNLACLTGKQNVKIQERAWTSPIWNLP